jgi:hypothetical protein
MPDGNTGATEDAGEEKLESQKGDTAGTPRNPDKS